MGDLLAHDVDLVGAAKLSAVLMDETQSGSLIEFPDFV